MHFPGHVVRGQTLCSYIPATLRTAFPEPEHEMRNVQNVPDDNGPLKYIGW